MNKIKVIDHTNLKEKGHTGEEWYKIIQDLRKCIVKVPEWVYFHFLEAVPPIYPKNGIGFFNSEPLCHNKEGKPIYYYFFEYNKGFYGCITSRDTQEFCYKLALEALK
jgi:hypothetical protein